MEDRKAKEIEYYDKKAEKLLNEQSKEREFGDFEGFKPQTLSSFAYAYKLLKENSKDKDVLDYGCGNGIHSFYPLKYGAKKVTGIDLSEKSLEIARARAKRENLGERMEFLKMDCEKMGFQDNTFDIIFDGGTFSSLDLSVVFEELVRLLKPGGKLIGIETFGHNPIANLKRKLNKASGKRTEWAEGHIFNKRHIEEAKKYFEKIDVYYFHAVSFLAIPLLGVPGGRIILKTLEFIDRIIFSIPFLRKYAFKVVFIFSNPKK